MGLGLLLLGAVALVAAHLVVRLGLPRRTFSASEAFVLGHWFFIYAGAVVVYVTGGRSWGTVSELGSQAFVDAALVCMLGLACFVFGSWLATVRFGRSRSVFFALPSSTAILLLASATLAAVGLVAGWLNRTVMLTAGLSDRSNVLLVVSQLLVPSALLSLAVIRDSRSGKLGKTVAGVLFVLAAVGISWEWTRRAMAVLVAALLFGGFYRRVGRLSRKRVFLAVPIMGIVAVFGVVWRIKSVFGIGFREIVQGNIFYWYLDHLWIETSAFSALAYLSAHFDLLQFRTFGPVIAPLLFWIPRSIFPDKPVGLELSGMLNTPYSLPPTIYGEFAHSVSILGMVPLMVFLGYVVKAVDLRFTWKPATLARRALYFAFVFDMLFVVRGSFTVMAVPIIMHCLVPLGLLEFLKLALQPRQSMPFPRRPSNENGERSLVPHR